MPVRHHASYADLVKHLAAGGTRPALTLDRVNAYAKANNLDVASATKRLAAAHADEAAVHERGDRLPSARKVRPVGPR